MFLRYSFVLYSFLVSCVLSFAHCTISSLSPVCWLLSHTCNPLTNHPRSFVPASSQYLNPLLAPCCVHMFSYWLFVPEFLCLCPALSPCGFCKFLIMTFFIKRSHQSFLSTTFGSTYKQLIMTEVTFKKNILREKSHRDF